MRSWFLCWLFYIVIFQSNCMCTDYGYKLVHNIDSGKCGTCITDNVNSAVQEPNMQDEINNKINDIVILWNNFNIFRDYVKCYLETISNNGMCYANEVCNDIAKDISQHSMQYLYFYSYWDAMSIVLLNYDVVDKQILESNGFQNAIDIAQSIVGINANNYLDLSKKIKDIILVESNKLESIKKIATWIVLNNNSNKDINSVCSDSE